MQVLLVHPNFPARFGHIVEMSAPARPEIL